MFCSPRVFGWFVCLCLGWPHACCLQTSSTPTHFAAFPRALLWHVVGAGQAHPWCCWGRRITAFPAACPIKCFVNALCSMAKQQSKVHKTRVLLICSWRRYSDGKIFQGRNYMFVLMSELTSCPSILIIQQDRFYNRTGPRVCVTVVVMTWSQSVVSFYVLFTYTLVCIYTDMLVYTYKCIYTHLHVYLSTVYIFYKHTHSLYIKKGK